MICAIIVAGGSGLRMKNTVRKQYLKIDGIPILTRTIGVFEKHPDVDRVFVVVPKEDFEFCSSHILAHEKNNSIKLVAGGKTRQDSVYNGIMALPPDTTMVLVHDGVRPFIRGDQISKCITAAKTHNAAMMGIPVADTLKQVDTENNVLETIERKQLWYAQTPQVFDYYLLRLAHEEALKAGVSATDDAALVERMGGTVKMIEGDKTNIKITTPEDLKMAEIILIQPD